MLLELLLCLGLSQNVRAPPSFEKLVSTHVNAIMEKGYAQTLSPDDFFHGHLIVRMPHNSCYSDMEDLESKVEFVLYHTAEHTSRWSAESASGSAHVPRSIVGFKDGSIRTAIDIITYEELFSKNTYDLFGTVFSDDLMRGKDYLHDGSKRVDPTCVLMDGAKEELSFQFRITPEREVYFEKR